MSLNNINIFDNPFNSIDGLYDFDDSSDKNECEIDDKPNESLFVENDILNKLNLSDDSILNTSSVACLTNKSLLSMIEDEYRNNSLNTYTYDKCYISVTDLVKNCPLQVVFRFLDNRFDLDIITYYPYTLLITEVGDALHKKLQSMFSNKLTKFEPEIQIIDDELMVKGYIDGKYVIQTNNEQQINVLVEIKTSSKDEIQTDDFVGRYYHWDQLILYKYLYDRNFGTDIDLLQLVYIARDFKPTKEYIKVKNKNVKVVKEPFTVFTLPVSEKILTLFDENKKQILKPKIDRAKRFAEKRYNLLMNRLEFIRKCLDKKQVLYILDSEIIQNEKFDCMFCPYNKVCKISLV